MDSQINFLYKTRMIALREKRTVFVENLHTLPDPRWDGAVARVARAGHVICGPDYAISRMSSPGFDLLYCREGQGTIRIGDELRRIGPSTCAVIAGDQPHGHFADRQDPWVLYWLRITGAEATEMMRLLFGPAGRIPIARGAAVTDWFSRLFDLMRARGTNQDLLINRQIGELWSLLNAERLALESDRLPPALMRLIAAMGARPELRWTAEDMVVTARMSAAQLRRLFSAHLQTTPRDWLRRQRIQRAQDLLLRQGVTVSAVAEACGFSDIYHFSREFRRVVGLSPTAWRQSDGGGGL